MPRGQRICPEGTVFHVLNRGNQRQRLFYSQEDDEALVRVVKETLLIIPTRILAYCLMPNHWHVLLWPERDWELSDFMHQMTTTHVRRWHKAHPSNGGGHVYQGRFKSFSVESDEHFYTVRGYVERNPVRARFIEPAEYWTWSSAWARLHPDDRRALPLCNWPLRCPEDWPRHVNEPLTDEEIKTVRTSAERGSPHGQRDWVEETTKALDLDRVIPIACGPIDLADTANWDPDNAQEWIRSSDEWYEYEGLSTARA
ncbi:MAG: transposase [Planctomycetota bacterium]